MKGHRTLGVSPLSGIQSSENQRKSSPVVHGEVSALASCDSMQHQFQLKQAKEDNARYFTAGQGIEGVQSARIG